MRRLHITGVKEVPGGYVLTADGVDHYLRVAGTPLMSEGLRCDRCSKGPHGRCSLYRDDGLCLCGICLGHASRRLPVTLPVFPREG